MLKIKVDSILYIQAYPSSVNKIFNNNDNNGAENDQEDSHDKNNSTIDRLHSKLTI
jgi:hypothetical protein